ncbi:MAG: hypothetical protein KKF44_06840 [Nanoarchaeota archaeon]|nr:hypothetical protein [Nanoarchaeota archaeon]
MKNLLLISLFILTLIVSGCSGGGGGDNGGTAEKTASNCMSPLYCYYDCIMEENSYTCNDARTALADDGREACDTKNIRLGENCYHYLESQPQMIIVSDYLCIKRSECYHICVIEGNEGCNELEVLTGEQGQKMCMDKDPPLQNQEECYAYLLEEEHPSAPIQILPE